MALTILCADGLENASPFTHGYFFGGYVKFHGGDAILKFCFIGSHSNRSPHNSQQIPFFFGPGSRRKRSPMHSANSWNTSLYLSV